MPIPAVWYSKDLLLRADTAHPLDIEEAMLSHTRLPELDSYCVVRRLCQLHRTPTERDRRECDPDLGDRYVDLLESFKCRPDRNHPDKTTCDFASVANHCTGSPPHAQVVHIPSSRWEGYRNSVVFPGPERLLPQALHRYLMHSLDLDKSVLCAGFTDDPALLLILKPSTATFSDDPVPGFDQSPVYERVGTINLLSTGHINPKEQESGQRTQLRYDRNFLFRNLPRFNMQETFCFA